MYGIVGVVIGVLDLGIDLDAWPWIWLSIAVVFAFVELTILAGTFVLLPFAVSAFLAALLGFYDAPIEAQWAMFVFGGAVLWFLMYRYVKRFMTSHEAPPGVGADRLVGMTGIVTKSIDPNDVDRRGRIQVEGEVWGALTADGRPIAENQRVRIVSVSGTRVMVEPVSAGAEQPSVDPPPTGPPTRPPTSPHPPPEAS